MRCSAAPSRPVAAAVSADRCTSTASWYRLDSASAIAVVSPSSSVGGPFHELIDQRQRASAVADPIVGRSGEEARQGVTKHRLIGMALRP